MGTVGATEDIAATMKQDREQERAGQMFSKHYDAIRITMYVSLNEE